jgi:hypothetical protein
MQTDEYGVDTLVEAYVALRDEKRDLERNMALKIEQLDKDMEVLTSAMKDLCKELGADSIRTAYGTVIRSIKTKYWTQDWSSFHRFMKDHDAFELLEKRIHQTNMKTFLEENPDLLPEGLNMDKEYAITIRKK